jgi:hypothetical protein
MSVNPTVTFDEVPQVHVDPKSAHCWRVPDAVQMPDQGASTVGGRLVDGALVVVVGVLLLGGGTHAAATIARATTAMTAAARAAARRARARRDMELMTASPPLTHTNWAPSIPVATVAGWRPAPALARPGTERTATSADQFATLGYA